MPVIINDFEIIADPLPPQPTSGAGDEPQAPEPPSLRPEDIARIVRHERLRLERVRAD